MSSKRGKRRRVILSPAHLDLIQNLHHLRVLPFKSLNYLFNIRLELFFLFLFLWLWLQIKAKKRETKTNKVPTSIDEKKWLESVFLSPLKSIPITDSNKNFTSTSCGRTNPQSLKTRANSVAMLNSLTISKGNFSRWFYWNEIKIMFKVCLMKFNTN